MNVVWATVVLILPQDPGYQDPGREANEPFFGGKLKDAGGGQGRMRALDMEGSDEGARRMTTTRRRIQ
jgi:hypothetical protein